MAPPLISRPELVRPSFKGNVTSEEPGPLVTTTEEPTPVVPLVNRNDGFPGIDEVSNEQVNPLKAAALAARFGTMARTAVVIAFAMAVPSASGVARVTRWGPSLLMDIWIWFAGPGRLVVAEELLVTTTVEVVPLVPDVRV